MLEQLKEKVLQANLRLQSSGLVILTWGNVSEIDEETKLVAIKPSGVPYENMTAKDIVIVNLEGDIIEGNLRPSSDLPTHLQLYKRYPTIKGICHTHSKWATIFSQANKSIEILGTTHADYFHGDIPVTRILSEQEAREAYELNTGNVIIEKIDKKDPLEIPAILCGGHGPFTFGTSGEKAVENAIVLEFVAEMAYYTRNLNNQNDLFKTYIGDIHYYRKHGKNAYYGQVKK
ncbi:MAG: L-ribulose-5-phosphate 4-epimerase AraD [Bacillales bacterium]|jgi:L-ribulose-5-phosphate 4-epimerase|nr:L-ribulose-5-phosphate 4-epimerase AraD [Bacillales bacterium]